MTVKPLKTGATYDDLREVSDLFIAELLGGELYATRRPPPLHSHALMALSTQLMSFDRDRREPDGWWILTAPELHFGDDVLVPNLVGWRRERLPVLPNADYMTLVPDWICEVLSPATETLDRDKKLPVYAREGVAHAWLLNPPRQTLEVLRLQSGRWIELTVHEGQAAARVEPFDAIELELGALWA